MAKAVRVGGEGERRIALIASCRHGQHQFSSPDGVFVDISEK
jgi:hypothetical protein